MAKAERYEPTGDLHVFDGGEDEDAPEEEGSRLALLLVLALFVLGAFGGVVYLAYTQGVRQGRDEAPRVVALPAPPPNAVAPAAKTPMPATALPKPAQLGPSTPAPRGTVPANGPAPKSVALATPPAPAVAKPLPQKATTTPARPAPSKTVATNAAPPQAVATHAPKQIAPALTPSSPTKLAQTKVTQATPTPLKQTEPATISASTSAAVTPKPVPEAPKAVPEVPKAAVTSPAATASAGAGGYVLQIGAYKSHAEADASWNAYKSAHPAAAGYAPDIRQVELPGKGTWYRLRIGSFASTADADTLCARLKASGASCFPAKR